MKLVRAVVVLAAATAATSGAADDRFELELERVALSGPGAQLDDQVDRRVKGVDDVEGWRANARWIISDRWSIRLGAELLDTEYESPLDGTCPFWIGTLYGVAFCQTVETPRTGTVEDELESYEIAVAHSVPLGDRLGVVLELGYRTTRWESVNDIEAISVVRCASLPGRGELPPGLIVGCETLDAKADEGGLLAIARIEWAATSRLRLMAAMHYQGYRYSIYRYDVIEQFEETNCDTARHCNFILPVVARDVDDGSWTWAVVRAEYALSPAWTVYLGGEGGGSRAWDGAHAGIRFAW
ncbi:MAG TPA: hypothetical protein VFG21_01125 [Xanthomonadaceae bacterium]|nr:hypothetical protein [Xanthomonadaceae bacterium]